MDIKDINEQFKKFNEYIVDDEEQQDVIDFVSTIDYDALRNHFLQNINPEVDYANLLQVLEGVSKEDAETYIQEFYVDNYNNLEEVKKALETLPRK